MKTPMKLMSSALALALFAAIPNAALADKGRGGGRTIDIKGRRSLLDLVEKSICYWREGADVKAENTSYKAILNTLRETHWYLAHLLESEIEALDFCFTDGQLIQIPTSDFFGVTVVEDKGNQTGIRFNDMVYLHTPHLNFLRKQERDLKLAQTQFQFMAGYFLLHEVMHSFIPYDVDRRNNSLMSIMAMIARNHETRMTPKDFALQMKRNQVDVIADVTPLNAYRTKLEIVLDPRAPIEKRQKTAFEIRKLPRGLLTKPDEITLLNLVSQEKELRDKKYVLALNHGTDADVIAAAMSRGNKESAEGIGHSQILQIAIRRGLFGYVAELLKEADATTDMSFEDGALLLHKQNQEALAMQFINHPEFIKYKSDDDFTKIMVQSAEIGWSAGVRAILPRRNKVFSAKVDMMPVLVRALEFNQKQTFQDLSNYPIENVNVPVGGNQTSLTKMLNGDWPELLALASGREAYLKGIDEEFLLRAATQGNLEVFKRLNKFEIPNSRERALTGFLVTAIQANHPLIAQELLKQKNINVNDRSSVHSYEAPAMYALEQGRLDILKLIMAEPKFNPNGSCSTSILLRAAHLGYTGAVKEFLALGDRVSDEAILCADVNTSEPVKRLIAPHIQRVKAEIKAREEAKRRRMN